MSATEVVDGQWTTVIDRLPEDRNATAMTVRQDGSLSEPLEPAQEQSTMQMLGDLGFIVPLATPAQLREVFAMKQRLYAAILDPTDYLYSVSYRDNSRGKDSQRQYVSNSRSEAESVAKKFNGTVSAKPKKAGIVKLARALGIIAVATLREERTYMGKRGYYVEYEAHHERTGIKERGVGWCDETEKGGYISVHDIIATADTRAYNRAILRLSGFGDVSADEIIAAPGDNDPPHVPEPQPQKEPEALPDAESDMVLLAQRAWAEGIAERTGEKYVAVAAQDTKNAREWRARARRGDAGAARKLGNAGLRWNGPAQDTATTARFAVTEPKITPEQVSAAKQAVAEDTALAALGTADAPASATSKEKKSEGWNLSSKGSAQDDASDASSAPNEEGIPVPGALSETITLGQAKQVSTYLKNTNIFPDIDKAKAWLRESCHVEKTTEIHANQYEAIVKALKKKETANG